MNNRINETSGTQASLQGSEIIRYEAPKKISVWSRLLNWSNVENRNSSHNETTYDLQEKLKASENNKNIAYAAIAKLESNNKLLCWVLISSLVVNGVLISNPSIVTEINKFLSPKEEQKKNEGEDTAKEVKKTIQN